MTSLEPKKLPYAVANFEKIIEDGHRFVDKTGYNDILRREKFEALFGELAIGRNPAQAFDKVNENTSTELRADPADVG